MTTMTNDMTTDRTPQERIVDAVTRRLGGEILHAKVTPCVLPGRTVIFGVPIHWFVELIHVADGNVIRYSGYASEHGGIVSIDKAETADPFEGINP